MNYPDHYHPKKRALENSTFQMLLPESRSISQIERQRNEVEKYLSSETFPATRSNGIVDKIPDETEKMELLDQLKARSKQVHME